MTTDLVMLNWDFLFCFFGRPQLTTATAKSEIRHGLLALTSVFVMCSYRVSHRCGLSHSSPCFCICACILAIISCIRLSWETQTQITHWPSHSSSLVISVQLVFVWETVPQPPSPARSYPCPFPLAPDPSCSTQSRCKETHAQQYLAVKFNKWSFMTYGSHNYFILLAKQNY